MKLSEIVSKLLGLEKSVADLSADKTKATDAAVTTLATEISSLKELANAELTQKTADLATAQASISSLTGQLEKAQGEVNSLGGLLKTACANLKLEAKEDSKSTELVALLENGVSSTLAKLNVPRGTIPNPPASSTQVADEKTKTRADFAKLTPAAQLAFSKAGGKIVE